MKTAAIIAEYNPFHLGHLYHLQKTKELTGADRVIVIMSGNFVQRGTPACMDKFTRTELALLSGADLVLELPMCYATSSAEMFAQGAVRSLEALGIVDYLVFGCETEDFSLLQQIAEHSLTESEQFRTALNQYLSQGMTYPEAAALALTNGLPWELQEPARRILAEPNNILAFSYLKALKECGSSIEPVPLLRKGSGYHDLKLSTAGPVSASALRQRMKTAETVEELLPFIPAEHAAEWTKGWKKKFPVLPDSLSGCLFQRLLMEDASSLTEYVDVTPDLANRIENLKNQFTSYTEFVTVLKSRQYTQLRTQRSLLHILLGLRQVPADPLYIRVLGFCSSGALADIQKHCTLPVLTRLSNAENGLSPQAAGLFRQEMRANDLYRYLVRSQYGINLPSDYENGMIIRK